MATNGCQNLQTPRETKPLNPSSSFSTSETMATNGLENRGRPDTMKVSYWKLFSFADRIDIGLMILGGLGALGNGLSIPLYSLLLGNVISSFGSNTQSRSQTMHDVSKVALHYVYLAIGSGISSFFRRGSEGMLSAISTGYVAEILLREIRRADRVQTCEVTCWRVTGERQASRIRALYLKAILRQDIEFFDTETSTGEVIGRMSGDTILIQEAMGEKVGKFIQYTSTFLGGFAIAFARGWLLSLILSACVPFVMASEAITSMISGRMASYGQTAYADAGNIVEQTVGGIRTVASFCGERLAIQKYNIKLQTAYETVVKQGLVSGAENGFVTLTVYSAYGLAIWAGSKLIIYHDYTGGIVVNVMIAIMMGAMSLGQTSPSLTAFAEGQAAAYKMFATINRKPRIDAYETGGLVLEDMKGEIDLKDVYFKYPTRPDVQIFSGISLHIPAGTTAALVGQSGSGKSTVISLLERFYDPDAGEVLIDGVNLKAMKLGWLREKLGLVSQEPALFATTIKENILYGNPRATDAEIRNAIELANAAKFIDKLPQGLDTMVGEHGAQLSGGQKQRIAISRAIVKHPRILLLDEATSALDAESEQIVQEALDRIMVHRTTVVVAHRLSTVRNADLIAVVHAGELLEKGTHSELIQDPNGAYFQLLSMQEGSKKDENTRSMALEKANSDDIEEDLRTSSQRMSLCRSISKGSSRRSSPLHITEVGTHSELIQDPSGAFFQPLSMQEGSQKDENRSMALEKANSDDIEEDLRTSSQRRSLHRSISKGSSRRSSPLRITEAAIGSHEKEKNSSTLGEHKNGSLRRLIFLNKPEAPLMLVGSIAACTNGVIFPVFGLLMSKVIRIMYEPPNELRKHAPFWSLMYVCLGVFSLLIEPLKHYLFGTAGGRLIRRVRSLSFEKVVHQEMSWFDDPKNSSGALGARLSGDASTLRNLVGDVLELVVQNFGTVAAGLLIALTANWKLGLIVLTMLLFSGSLGFSQMKFLGGGYVRDAKTEQEEASQIANDAVGSIRTIASFCAEEKVMEMYNKKCEAPIRSGVRFGLIGGIGLAAVNFFHYCSYAACFYIGAIFVLHGQATFGQVFRIFYALAMATVAVSQTADLAPDIGKVKAATISIFEILDKKSKIDSGTKDGLTLERVKGDIELENVSFKYPIRPDIEIFKGLCLSIPAGKMVALVGESGSGKSTIISLIQRFYDPDSGEVYLDGVDLKRLKISWLRHQMGLVSQEPTLFNETIRANVSYGKQGNVTEEEIISATRAANAHNFISSLPQGYDTTVGEKGIQLSGGQKQRIAIARAILKDPKILLLDEATSALDAESERIVQDALDNVIVNRTTVVVAHRLSTVKCADVIAVVKNGTIGEKGRHEALMQIPSGTYSSLVALQSGAGSSA